MRVCQELCSCPVQGSATVFSTTIISDHEEEQCFEDSVPVGCYEVGG